MLRVVVGRQCVRAIRECETSMAKKKKSPRRDPKSRDPARTTAEKAGAAETKKRLKKRGACGHG